MKNYVINLDRSADRLAHCHNQFGRLNLSFERVQAVDARALTQETIDSISVHKDWPKPTISEFACFMSHRKCWELLVSSNEKYAAIFEDDIILTEGATDFLRNYDWIPSDFNLLRLETFRTKVYFKRWGKVPVNNRHLLRMVSFQSGAGGYVLSHALAAKLLKLTDQYMPVPVDHFLFDPDCEVYASNNIYQLAPAICAQEQVLTTGELSLGLNIEDRSIVNMIRKKRGTLTQREKIARELKRGVIKLRRLATDKRMIVETL